MKNRNTIRPSVRLEPCPFCTKLTDGSHVMAETVEATGQVPARSHIICTQCGASSAWQPTPEDAARLWNTREPMAGLQDSIREIFRHYNSTKKLQAAVEHAAGIHGR